MTELELYYNKFNEEKRLNSRHGQVEFRVSMKYIHEMLEKIAEERKIAPEQKSEIAILDIGAGTGRYSVPLAEEGYDVTAVELVKHNLGILKAKGSSVKAYQGNALKLKRFASESFDLTLLFGPMYHLFGQEDKLQALREAKRVTKPGGIIMVAYCMNEYGVLTYAFKERHILECVEEKRLTEDFKTISFSENLYDYMRVEEIDALVQEAGLCRIRLLSPDGPANYMRPFLNQLTEEEFEHFVQYQMATCERPDLIGAGAHTLDILKK
ncbi:MAG: class I SAM-dependent methyltransferase [Lachnospiraceae bacterium]|nr:class I SAM-dependent methyltransferase [Lachnospiraceae bacterium]